VLDPWLSSLGRAPAVLRRLALAAGGLSARYPWASRVLAGPRELTRARYELLIAPFGAEHRRGLYAADLRAAIDAAPEREEWAEAPEADWHPFDRLQRYELTLPLVDFIVPTLDRGSMAHGVEARVPFLDHELVELSMRIPPWEKARALTGKRVLREAMRGVLPDAIRARRKWGLRSPFARWLRGRLPEFAAELLAPAAVRAKGYFEPSAVEAMLARHRAGALDVRSLVPGILAVQLWDELFVRGRDPSTLAPSE
jgi:asparagine synthase (glutamine-hydrolysing)